MRCVQVHVGEWCVLTKVSLPEHAYNHPYRPCKNSCDSTKLFITEQKYLFQYQKYYDSTNIFITVTVQKYLIPEAFFSAQI